MLLLLLVPALVTRPFVKLGSVDRDGNHPVSRVIHRRLRVAHGVNGGTCQRGVETTQSVSRDERVHYYWTYFRVPATLANRTSVGIQAALKLNAFATALLLVAAIYAAAWVALADWPFVVALAVALTILCPSAEGLAGIVDVVRRGLPFSELGDLNIDALAAWAFKGLRIETCRALCGTRRSTASRARWVCWRCRSP